MAEGTRTASLKTFSLETGISLPTVYRSAREDRLPVRVIRFPGTRQMLVSRAELDELLSTRKNDSSRVSA